MICTKCGREINNGSAFCPFCGNSVVPAEPQVQSYDPYGQQQYADQQAYDQYGQQQYYDQQAYDQYGQQQYADQQAYGQYYQQAQSYGQPYAAAAPQSSKPVSKAGRKWPIACGVMAIIALVIYLAGVIIPSPYPFSTGIMMIIVFVLMIVEFFVHTKKIAWVTIFPFAIYVVFEIVAQIGNIGVLFRLFGSSWAVTSEILYLLFPVVLFILYALTMIIRPKNWALRILFLIFMIIEVILLLISVYTLIYQGITTSAGEFILFPLFSRLAFIFFYLGHGIAVMSIYGR